MSGEVGTGALYVRRGVGTGALYVRRGGGTGALYVRREVTKKGKGQGKE